MGRTGMENPRKDLIGNIDKVQNLTRDNHGDQKRDQIRDHCGNQSRDQIKHIRSRNRNHSKEMEGLDQSANMRSGIRAETSATIRAMTPR